MSPQQLVQFKELSRLFEKGEAIPTQIKELSELLALLNTDDLPKVRFG